MIYADYELSSEELAKVYDWQDRLRNALEWKLQPLIRLCTVALAKEYFGGKAGLIKAILQDSAEMERIRQGELTEEEKAELDRIEEYQKEHVRGDFTPPTENPLYDDVEELARWLFIEAEQKGEKAFDELFEHILMNRYNKKVLRVKGEDVEVWEKQDPTLSEEILY